MTPELAYTMVSGFAILFIGVMVYFHERTSFTNKLFFLISIATVLWANANYFSLTTAPEHLLFWVRLVLFFAVPHAVLLLLFTINFPKTGHVLSKGKLYAVLVVTALAMLATISPLVFSGTKVSASGSLVPVPGPLMPFFAFVVLSSLFGSMFLMWKKYRNANNLEKTQWRAMLVGTISSYILLIITNFVLVIFFQITYFTFFAPLFMLPTFLGMAIAILRHHFLNIKAITAELITFILLVIALFEVFISVTTLELVMRMIIFTLYFIFGIFLIRSVLKEVEQREQIQKLATELQLANDQQTVLIHFITHQIKGFFTMSRNIFSLMLENTFGELAPDMRRMAQQGFDNTTKGVTTVQEILNAANLKKGTVAMKMAPFDIRELVEQVLGELKPRIEAAALHVESTLPQGPLSVMGDRFQLHEVFKNLIDNAIRYTPKGTIAVKLDKRDMVAHFEVKDSGVGLSDDDKKKLFTEGGRGKESLKVNVDSTGFGLYIVKGIVDQHKGKVWAESEGQGKGSTFMVDLPLAV